jgi:hypothetical protein
MSFYTGTVVEQLYSLSAAVTKNTYTTIAAYTGVAGTNPICSIPAGFFLNMNPNPVGRGLYLEMHGTIANTAAATFANAINVNPTVATSTGNIAINAAYTPTASVTAPFWVKCWITCTVFASSTMTLQINGEVNYHSVASGGAPTTTQQTAGFTGSIASLDPRVTQYVELFGTWSASSSSNTTTVQQMKLFGCN